MTYYEGFDQKSGKPFNEKGKIPLQGVGHVNVAHAKKRFCWVIRHENRRPVYMSAENENEKYVWLESIEKASKIKNGEVSDEVLRNPPPHQSTPPKKSSLTQPFPPLTSLGVDHG